MSKTVAKALAALEHVRAGPLTLSELASRLGTHASTAMRMLAPVVEAGLLSRGNDGRYRLGHRLVELGQDALEAFDLRTVAHPHLVELSADTRCTVHLAQLVDGEIVYTDKVEAPGAVRMWSRIGRPVPLHTAAASKVILAELPAPERRALYDGWEFTPYTEHTVRGPDELERRVAEAARTGFATDSAEFEPLIYCVGVAIRAGEGPAAVSVTAVREPPSDDDIAATVDRVRTTVRAIEKEIGRGPRPEEDQ